ncbi:MAG: hypothetical protein EOO61_09140 [Hymenobacter sp.]|nr:MAG: hypothetical protein EOO61_09140 [Hymenobacter sp.]
MFDALRSSDRVRDQLIYTDEPWNDEQSRERPEGEPLQEADHFLREVSHDLAWKGKRYNHYG